MIVISNSSPINYLVLLDEVEILPALYERVIIPQAVSDELQDTDTPAAVREWVATRPRWLEVRQPSVPLDAAPKTLHPGERDTIALGQELRADVLIMDERQGRREAQRRKLLVIGTLGVLDKAAKRGLIDLPQVIARLQQTTFYASPERFRTLLERDADRKRSSGERGPV